MQVKLGKFLIGDGQSVRIIAEAADCHNGKVETAKDLVLAAKKAGVDIIKFQLHLPDIEMIPGSIQMWDGPLYNILKRNLLSIEQHKEIKDFCEKQDVMYLCTPFCPKAADLLDEIGVDAFKIGSGEMTNIPMLQHIARKKKPMLVSTGMSEWDEIKETVEAIKNERCPLILMNCTSEYPPKYEDINLGLIEKMEKEFEIPVGHSDHTPDIYTALGAVAIGAKIIEKHFTLDRSQPGPDHFLSLEPKDLAMLVDGVRKIEKAMGKEKKIHEAEKAVRQWALHSVVAKVDIPQGTEVTARHLIVKRPGTGIPAKDWKKVVGKKAKIFIPKDTLLNIEDLI